MALAGIGGDAYSGRLTGYLADPNAAAYFLVVLGVIAIFFADERWKVRAVLGVPILVGLVLTYLSVIHLWLGSERTPAAGQC